MFVCLSVVTDFFFSGSGRGVEFLNVFETNMFVSGLMDWPFNLSLEDKPINPRLTKLFFVTRLTKRGVVTAPSLDFPNQTLYEIDFGIKR